LEGNKTPTAVYQPSVTIQIPASTSQYVSLKAGFEDGYQMNFHFDPLPTKSDPKSMQYKSDNSSGALLDGHFNLHISISMINTSHFIHFQPFQITMIYITYRLNFPIHLLSNMKSNSENKCICTSQKASIAASGRYSDIGENTISSLSLKRTTIYKASMCQISKLFSISILHHISYQ
jgi:hypothetical protein